ncbi:hypothetical protein [Schleiferilactobacillus shenzhenensis]|uniref:ABC3 transporter permease protein domain-containing protein n=1 Tax=Schleiferilactobacillus shenzhenensis LY-73 TaxID=1231336 RepID=U4TPI6_9LACO|nr:hypothetical protein [Schleiferilactobacillus shenzhenensis]ERL66154.1 hypothetical protein L248_1246 [Schleiferilactobacillus shenzhenensis LY-73]
MKGRAKRKIIGRILHHNILFWLSTVFLVAAFYILMSGYAVAATWTQRTQNIFVVAAVLSGLFFTFFFYYGQRYILRQYRQEVALYQLWGITRRRLYGGILWLNVLLLGLVLGLGLFFGMLFMPLAVLLLQRFMGMATRFVGPWSTTAVLATVATFAGTGLLTQVGLIHAIHALQPVTLLHGEKSTRLTRRRGPSGLFALYGVVATTGGFWIARRFWWLIMVGRDNSGMGFVGWLLAILVLVVSGEYAVIRSGLPWLFTKLRRLPRWPLKNNRLLRLTRLTRQFREQAAVIWLAAVLLAVVVTWAGLLTTTVSVTSRDAVNQSRMTFVTTSKQAWQDLDNVLTQAGITNLTRRRTTYKVRVANYELLNHQTGKTQAYSSAAAIMPLSEYQRLQQVQQLPPLPELRGNEVATGDVYSSSMSVMYATGARLTLNQPGIGPLRRVAPLAPAPYTNGAESPTLLPDIQMVVSNSVWQRLTGEQHLTLYGVQVNTALSAARTRVLLAKLRASYRVSYYSAHTRQQVTVQTSRAERAEAILAAPIIQENFRRGVGIDIFIGCVLSVVILFAVNSMLTMRAWADREAGVDLFFALGMTATEIRQGQDFELVWRYGLPVAIAAINAVFALQMLWAVTITTQSVILFLLVLGAVAVVSGLFFMLSAQLVRRSVVPR